MVSPSVKEQLMGVAICPRALALKCYCRIRADAEKERDNKSGHQGKLIYGYFAVVGFFYFFVASFVVQLGSARCTGVLPKEP